MSSSKGRLRAVDSRKNVEAAAVVLKLTAAEAAILQSMLWVYNPRSEGEGLAREIIFAKLVDAQ